ncbi:hypothetical protein D9758_013570 [Tetrapyrgos nigripes]|uniref:Uncharacterized protein n=1 Tax=Tetrapyrgos nigripes TaxID=182062 RepID=A0A8H5CH36_9AGAR|nr:hypothetical protein D9758_013570 [Tetrapyrgos nigripes]
MQPQPRRSKRAESTRHLSYNEQLESQENRPRSKRDREDASPWMPPNLKRLEREPLPPTPPKQSVEQVLKNLDKGSKNRVESVERTPGLCNVTNEEGESPGNDVDWCHVIARCMQGPKGRLEMTLIAILLGTYDVNVNTRGNIIRLITYLHRLFDGGQYLMVPCDEELVNDILLEMDGNRIAARTEPNAMTNLIKKYNLVSGSTKWRKFEIVPINNNNLGKRHIFRQKLKKDQTGSRWILEDSTGSYEEFSFGGEETTFLSHINPAILVIHILREIRGWKITDFDPTKRVLRRIWTQGRGWLENTDAPEPYLKAREKFYQDNYKERAYQPDRRYKVLKRNQESEPDAKGKQREGAVESERYETDTDDELFMSSKLAIPLLKGENGMPFKFDLELADDELDVSLQDVVDNINRSPSARGAKSQTAESVESLEQHMEALNIARRTTRSQPEALGNRKVQPVPFAPLRLPLAGFSTTAAALAPSSGFTHHGQVEFTDNPKMIQFLQEMIQEGHMRFVSVDHPALQGDRDAQGLQTLLKDLSQTGPTSATPSTPMTKNKSGPRFHDRSESKPKDDEEGEDL